MIVNARKNLRLLIEHGADINKTDKDGRNALIHAARNIYYQPEIIKIFIESGININSQDNNGRDALEIMNLQNNNASKREIFYRYVLPLMIKSGADAKFYNNINLLVNIIICTLILNIFSGHIRTIKSNLYANYFMIRL